VVTTDALPVLFDKPSLNAQSAASALRIQFTTDARYQAFLPRAVDAVVLGMSVRVACLDLIRLAEAWPGLRAIYPAELLEQIDRG